MTSNKTTYAPRDRSEQSDEWSSGPTVDEQFPERHADAGADAPPARTSDSAPAETDDHPASSERTTPDGRSLAILSHMSLLFGLPVFIIPLLQRNNALALHHAKAAALIYFGFYGTLILSMYSTGLFLPLAMLFYLPGLVGIYRAINHEPAGRWGLGDLAERLFPHPAQSSNSGAEQPKSGGAEEQKS